MPGGQKWCVYCGAEGVKLTRDHVFPRGLYPRSKSPQSVQRLTVPACGPCNNAFSDDEAHFRTVVALAGPASETVATVWRDQIVRSWSEPDGRRRLVDLWSILERSIENGEERLRIYPARDERVLRVIKKAVRALSHTHKLATALPQARVWADVLRFALPTDLEEQLVFRGGEKNVVDYAYLERPGDGLDAIWLIRFFGRTTFIASVSSSAPRVSGINE